MTRDNCQARRQRCHHARRAVPMPSRSSQRVGRQNRWKSASSAKSVRAARAGPRAAGRVPRARLSGPARRRPSRRDLAEVTGVDLDEPALGGSGGRQSTLGCPADSSFWLAQQPRGIGERDRGHLPIVAARRGQWRPVAATRQTQTERPPRKDGARSTRKLRQANSAMRGPQRSWAD